MGHNLVEIRPHELQFTFEVKKESSCVVRLINNSKEYVAFRVQVTCPDRYDVYPNTGVILPWKTCECKGLLTAPPGMQLKDKFLVQTTVVPHGTTDKQLVPAFFSKDTGRTEESILGVVLVRAHQSLEEQPTNEIHDVEDPAPALAPEDVELEHLKPRLNDLESKLEEEAEDVEHLKSRLNDLESKFEESEKKIKWLQQGMGFCLSFVVMAICILLGYLQKSSEHGMHPM